MASNEIRIREEICRTGKSLYDRRYTVGTAGNISSCLEDGWLITPTDACLDLLDPNDIAKVDLHGNHGWPHRAGATAGKTPRDLAEKFRIRGKRSAITGRYRRDRANQHPRHSRLLSEPAGRPHRLSATRSARQTCKSSLTFTTARLSRAILQ
jgi:hypothetical protein